MRFTRDRRAVLRRLKDAGAEVRKVYRTGEAEIIHPRLAGLPSVRWNSRRQDVPVAVLKALRFLEESA